jgi:hypothetical protein
MAKQNPTEIMTVTITLAEYQRLLYVDAFMDALVESGVDNWGGYSEACDMMRAWAEPEE